MGKYLLAIDGGTGSIRSALFDLDGNQIAISWREWTHHSDPQIMGSMNFDCAVNWDLTVQTIRECIVNVDPDDILACAATSMREGIVLYDDANREIFACANVDSRAAAEGRALKETLGLEEELYSLSGQTFSLGAISRLFWVKNNLPEIYAKTRHINMLNDWISFKLTGLLTSEPSNGCTTGMFDLSARKWDDEILARCNLKTGIFPNVYECGESIGNISKKAAVETGLSENTLVVAGGGDAQLGCVGIGAVSSGQAAILGGSFWQYEYNTDRLIMDKGCRVRVNCHAVPNIWQYEAIAFFPGLLMKWYKNTFCGADTYARAEEQAAAVPVGSHGMICTFSDIMNYISWRHAAPTFTDFAFDTDKFNRYTFYRAIMESAAYVCRGHLELVKEVTGLAPEYIMFAGGASKSPLWGQILSDVLKLPVKTPVVKEATSLGAAICAGVGVGVYENVAAARLVKIEREYKPNTDDYDKYYEKWKRVYSKQLELADSGVTNYMWSG